MNIEDKYWLAGFVDGIISNPLLRRKDKEGNIYLWKWEFSAPNNNELLRFFKERLNAKIVKGYKTSGTVRFTKTSLIGIIDEIGPYIRNKREVFEEIAKQGKSPERSGGSIIERCRPIEMPTQQFEVKYQKHYAAGMLEASANPYVGFHPDEKRNKVGLQRNLGLSPLFSKFLKHYNIKTRKLNATAKKITIGGTQDIIKFLKILTPAVRFRNELISFYNLLLELEHLDSTSKAKKVQQYNEAVKSYIFDESLIDRGIDGNILRKVNIESKKALDKEKKVLKEVKEIVQNIKPHKVRAYGAKIRESLKIINSKLISMDKLDLKIEEALSDQAFCRDCKKTLPKDQFSIDKSHHHGRSLYCKPCVSKKVKKMYRENPKYKARQKEYYRKNKEWIKAYVKEYNKTYVHIKDDYDKYLDVPPGDAFEGSKTFAKYGITLKKGRGTSKKEFHKHLEEEWELLPEEIKDMFNLPHKLTAKEIFQLRKNGFIDLDHIIPKAVIKRLVKRGHAKGMAVSPHHTLNFRPLPKDLNQSRSDSPNLIEYYPDCKKRIGKIWRSVFSKML